MRVFYILVILSISIYAKEYFSRAYAKDEFHIKSAVNGKVIDVSLAKEGRVSDGEVIIQLDDKLDRIDLNNSIKKRQSIIESISLLKELIENSKRSKDIALKNYNRIKNLQSYSQLQKDSKLNALIAATNSYIQSKNSLQEQKNRLYDLNVKIANLKDRIDKKRISVKRGFFIDKIYPNIGDFINVTSPLIDVFDLSKAKLIVYVGFDELNGLRDKKIYIDGNVTDYKIDKIWRVADKTNISEYRVEIIIDAPKIFSKLVKVEFK